MGTMLLRRRTGSIFIVVAVSTIILTGIVARLLAPELAEADHHCGVGGIFEQYRACHTQVRHRVAARLGMCIAVPTTIGIACTMTVLHFYVDAQAENQSALNGRRGYR